jgi:glycerol-3-phosphate dehydrogenase
VRNDIAVIVSVPGDKRSVFLVPWGELPDGTFEHCYVGTTDTDYDGQLDAPRTDHDDIEYLLRALNHSLTNRVTVDDITGAWAGLRPLVVGADSTRTADLSRRHRVAVTDSGLISVTGGKLTTYRRMAADTVDAAARALGRRARSKTKRLRLVGADGSVEAEIRALIALDQRLAEPLVPGLQYRRAEAVYAVRREMATTLDDVLLRRTRAHLHDRNACLAAAEDVAALLAAELGWTADQQAAQVAAYRALCDAELSAMQSRTVGAGAP